MTAMTPMGIRYLFFTAVSSYSATWPNRFQRDTWKGWGIRRANTWRGRTIISWSKTCTSWCCVGGVSWRTCNCLKCRIAEACSTYQTNTTDEYDMWLNEMANIPFNMTAASITCFLVCHHMCVSRRWSSIFTSHIPPSAVACLICGFKRSRGTCVDSGGLGRSRFALLNQVDAHPTPSPCIIPTKFKSITSVTSLPEVASMVNKTTAR